ncbi:MAG: alkaline phosphatase family protein [Chloroflexi bacterium]|nr:alkaline phosphatase family protein [Chloroflexota bacterium]
MTRKRTVIVGLDGMPYRLIKDLAGNGTMPNMKGLIEEGVFRQMESSIPEVSSVAWSSIISGANPGMHGIFGFTDLAPETYRTFFPNFNTLKAMPFWERAGSGQSVIINVPTTYPAREMNGVLIAGFVAPDLEKATYPPSLVPKLRAMDYRVDVDSQRAKESISFFLKDLDRTLRARTSAYRYLWPEEEWDIFMLVFTGTDRLAHFLWDAYEDESHTYHSAFLDHFRQIDEVIGQIVQGMEDDDVIMLLSDHGFELLEKEVYVNVVLKQEGFLRFNRERPASLKDIGDNTKAFALDPARIYVNLKGRYPKGCVHPEDREAVVADLESIFGSLQIDGKRVLRRVYQKEEIYNGPFFEQAPDLVLVANEGYNLRASIKATQLCGKDIRTGKHSQHDAFLLVRGEGAGEIVPEKPSVADVVGIMDQLCHEFHELTRKGKN